MAEDKRQWSQADTIAMALVTAVAGVIRGIHLSMPADLFGDEIFYAREACIYVYQSRQICGIPLDAVSPHPPLGKSMVRYLHYPGFAGRGFVPSRVSSERC